MIAHAWAIQEFILPGFTSSLCRDRGLQQEGDLGSFLLLGPSQVALRSTGQLSVQKCSALNCSILFAMQFA